MLLKNLLFLYTMMTAVAFQLICLGMKSSNIDKIGIFNVYCQQEML